MNLALHLLIFAILGFIAVEDYKYRAVSLFLLLLLCVFGITLNYLINPFSFFSEACINLLLLSFILLVAFLYAKFKMKVSFFKEAFGLGDLLFFIALAFSQPSLRFIILFSSCLIFSLVIHLVLSRCQRHQSIPLAGYSAIFLIIFYGIDITMNYLPIS